MAPASAPLPVTVGVVILVRSSLFELPESEAASRSGADGAAVIEANDVAVPGGANVTVVAHLNEGGTPVLTPFVNDIKATAAGQARITVRHTAAAPAVDVRANGAVAFPGLTNPNEAKTDLPAGAVSADVVLAGTDTVATWLSGILAP